MFYNTKYTVKSESGLAVFFEVPIAIGMKDGRIEGLKEGRIDANSNS